MSRANSLALYYFSSYYYYVKPLETAYEMGVQQAFREHMEKEAKSKFVSKVRNFLDTTAGHNIRKTIGEQHAKVMQSPLVVQQVKKTPKDMSTFESYITKALESKKVLPGVRNISEEEFKRTAPKIRQWINKKSPEKFKKWYGSEHFELPAETIGRNKLVDDLTTGHRAVSAQRKTTRDARLALSGGLAIPAAGGVMLSKEGTDSESRAAPAAAAGAVGALPVMQGLRSGALGVAESKGRALTLEQLQKTVRPGDVLLTSGPGYSSSFKAPIAAMGGDPYGYHVESVVSNPKRGAPSYIHSTPGAGGAAMTHGKPAGDQDVIVKRLKDKTRTKEFVRNLKGYGKREDVLRNMLGAEAPREMYDAKAAVKGGTKSFLPERLRKLLFKDTAALPGATICSSLPGMACPVDLAPGVAKHEIMPHHIQRSAALETAGHYRAPRKMYQRTYENLLRASPWITRGALGAGLGYGAYKGMQKLLD